MNGDKTPYLQDGIFVSLGNFIFDTVLLLVELGVIFSSLWSLNKMRREEVTT